MAKRILIVNVNWVGDVLFSTPFIKAVRENYPESYIACLLHPRCLEMLEGNKRLNEIIIYDEEARHKSLIGKMRLVAYIRKKHFDIAFILHRSFTKALITKLAGIRERVGYATKNRSFLLTKPIEDTDQELHKVEYFLNIARACGIRLRDPSYEFFVENSDRDFARDFMKSNGLDGSVPFIIICPGGNWDPKRWPAANFAKVSDILIQRFNAKIAIAGAEKDIKLAEHMKAMMINPPIIAAGKTTLKQLGALMERADLVIANDTGPMHIAIAMKARTIALFGPTSPKITGPYGEGEYRVISKNEDCEIPCYDVTCTDNRCMAAIKVEDVLEEAEAMLGDGLKHKAQK